MPPKVRRVGFRTLGGFCVPVLFFFGLSVWCVLGLPGLAGCLSVGPLSGLVVDSGGHQDRGWVAILWRVW